MYHIRYQYCTRHQPTVLLFLLKRELLKTGIPSMTLLERPYVFYFASMLCQGTSYTNSATCIRFFGLSVFSRFNRFSVFSVCAVGSIGSIGSVGSMGSVGSSNQCLSHLVMLDVPQVKRRVGVSVRPLWHLLDRHHPDT